MMRLNSPGMPNLCWVQSHIRQKKTIRRDILDDVLVVDKQFQCIGYRYICWMIYIAKKQTTHLVDFQSRHPYFLVPPIICDDITCRQVREETKKMLVVM